MEIDRTSVRIIVQYADYWRAVFNRKLDHLEQWQIVLYTIATILLVQWVKKVLKNEEFASPAKWWRELRMNIPSYRSDLNERKEAAYKEIEEHLLRFDRAREFYKFLPDHGLAADDILQEAIAYKEMGDVLFECGRMCGASFLPVDGGGQINGPALSEDCADSERTSRLFKEVFDLYAYTNASFPEIFPACRKMESEVIRMLCSIYHGSASSCGVLTTSGSESILLACLAYRNRAIRRGIRKPELIVGRNAHVAFAKASKLLGLRLVRVAVNQRHQLNVGAVKCAIGPETCMIVASAPGFVTGVVDNIDEIAKLGQRFNVPVHVDASIGGFVIPFMEQCDYPAPPFDFRLPGVTSISVDLHKYAYCPMGASAVLYRGTSFLRHQAYVNVNWPGGVYVSQTLGDSRSGLSIALVWTTMLRQGRFGYVEKTQRILDAATNLRQNMAAIEALEVIGDPLGPVIAFTTTAASGLSAYKLGAEMNKLGWSVGFIQEPAALRICLAPQHTRDNIVENFSDDLRRTVEKLLSIAKTTEIVDAPATSVFGLSVLLDDHGIIEHLPYAYLDALYATPNQPHGSQRTLSIEGRKLSLIAVPAGLTALRQRLQSIDRTGSGGQSFNSLLLPTRE